MSIPPTGTKIAGDSTYKTTFNVDLSIFSGTRTGTNIVLSTLEIAGGGTGQTTANAALNALLPSQTGNPGKVLQTDGTNTSWASGAISSQWTTTGSNIYYTTGNVGIGTTAPTQKLDVRGNIGISNATAGGEVYNFGIGTTAQMTMNLGGVLGFRYGTISNTSYGQFTIRDGFSNTYPAYSFLNDTNTGISNAGGTADTLNFITGGSEMMRIDSAGKVGIGTASPTSKLHVVDSITGAGSTSILTSNMTTASTGNISQGVQSLYPKPIIGSGISNTGYISGLYIEALRNNVSSGTDDSGTLTNSRGVSSSIGHYYTNRTIAPTTSNVSSFYSTPYINAGTISNFYGLYLGNKITIAPVTWSANATIAAGTYIAPTVANGYYFYTAAGGTTGATEPTWTASQGATGTDNTVSYTATVIPSITNYYGIYQQDSTAKNYFAGNVGINVASYTNPLNVETSGTGTTVNSNRVASFLAKASGREAHIAFGDNTNATAQVGYINSGALYMATNGSERMRIDIGGNVGIGTTSPGTTLDVVGSIRAKVEASNYGGLNGGLVVQRTTNDSQLYIGFRTTPDVWAINASYTTTGAYKPIAFLTSDTERMRIDTGGNVGIGNTSPNSKLQVSGPIATALTSQTGSTYSIAATDSVILMAATSGTQTVTLPTAVGCTGRQYTIKRTATGGTSYSIATTSSQTIDGSTTQSLGSLYQAITVVSDGSNWFIL